MLAFRVDRWVRIVAAAGLLCLLIAQQKLCPWLASPPHQPEPRTATPPTDVPAEDPAAQKSATRPLPYLLPGTCVTAPRLGGVFDQTAQRQGTGWHDGVVSCGPREPQAAPDVPAAPPGSTWRDLQCLAVLPWIDGAQTDVVHLDQPAIGSVIQRTGPPGA